MAKPIHSMIRELHEARGVRYDMALGDNQACSRRRTGLDASRYATCRRWLSALTGE